MVARIVSGMSVRQLIDELSKQDPEATVWADGCDCTNPVKAVREDEFQGDKQVVLEVSL